MSVGGESFARMLAAWERTTAHMAEAVVRHPRTLELGSRMLKSHLLWKKAFDTAFDAMWTPFRRDKV